MGHSASRIGNSMFECVYSCRSLDQWRVIWLSRRKEWITIQICTVSLRENVLADKDGRTTTATGFIRPLYRSLSKARHDLLRCIVRTFGVQFFHQLEKPLWPTRKPPSKSACTSVLMD